jgi:hypothetical protein
MTLAVRALFSAFLVLIGLDCHAQQAPDAIPIEVWLNPGSFSYHFDRDKNLRGDNTGFGAELKLTEDHLLASGSFINSDRMRSRYGAYFWRPLHWEISDVKLHAGIAVGGFDGYPHYRDGGWFPAVLPTLAIEGDRLGANLFFVPTIANRLNGALSLQLKVRIW